MGEGVLDFIDNQPGYEALAVDKSGLVRLSSGMAKLLG